MLTSAGKKPQRGSDCKRDKLSEKERVVEIWMLSNIESTQKTDKETSPDSDY